MVRDKQKQQASLLTRLFFPVLREEMSYCGARSLTTSHPERPEMNNNRVKCIFTTYFLPLVW